MSQSVTVALQICLVDLLGSWGVRPSVVVSHSSGEIAAAYAAGALSSQEALGVAYFRDELATKYRLSDLGGGMLAVGMGAVDVARYLSEAENGDAVVVACVNSPSSVTLSGDGNVLEELAFRFQKENVFARKLRVPVAHHSRHMDSLAQDYSEILRVLLAGKFGSSARLATVNAPPKYVSPVTGSTLTSLATLRDSEYWKANLTQPVLFHQAMEALLWDSRDVSPEYESIGIDVLVEIGPHSQLESVIKEITGGRHIQYVSCLKRKVDAVATMQEAAGILWQLGCPVKFNSINSPNDAENELLSGVPLVTQIGDIYQATSKAVSARLVWELDLVHRLDASSKQTMAIRLDNDQLKYERNIKRASYYFINDAITKLEKETDGQNFSGKENASQDLEFYDWMRSVVARGKQGKLGPRSNTWAKASKGMKQRLWDEVASASPLGKMLTVVGPWLADIVRGETTGAEMGAREDLIDQYYEGAPVLASRMNTHIANVVQHFAVAMPGASVLGVGPGATAAAKVVLEAFSATGDGSSSLLGHLTLADTTSRRLCQARKRLARWGEMVDFVELETGPDSLAPLADIRFEVVFLSSLHHGDILSPEALANIRKLLVPGGKLMIVEPTSERLEMGIVLGVPPAVQVEGSGTSLDQMLRESGFSGIDFEIGDCEDVEIQSFRLVLSTAVGTSAIPAAPISIICAEATPAPWLGELAKSMEAEIKSLSELQSSRQGGFSSNGLLIITVEADDTSLRLMNKDDMEGLKGVLGNSEGVLWISRGAFTVSGASESAELLSLIRTNIGQHAPKPLVQLDLESGIDIKKDSDLKFLLHVWNETLGRPTGPVQECLYAVRNSCLHVPRFYPAPGQQMGLSRSPQLNGDATYLVIGEVGPMAYVVVLWLIDKGAKSILLVSPDIEPGCINQNIVWRASQAGCLLHGYKCDLSNDNDASSLLTDHFASLPPLRGIVQIAGGLEARFAQEHDPHSSRLDLAGTHGPQQYDKVFEILDSSGLLRKSNPDIEFSLVLSPAPDLQRIPHTFLQSQLPHRVEHGRPATLLSIIRTTTEAAVVRMLDAAVSSKTAQLIFDSNDGIFREEESHSWPAMMTPLILATNRAPVASDTGPAPSPEVDAGALLQGADTATQVVEALASKIGSVTGSPGVDAALPVSSHGVDSMVASELRGWVLRHMGVNVSILDIIDSPSLDELGSLLISRRASHI